MRERGFGREDGANTLALPIRSWSKSSRMYNQPCTILARAALMYWSGDRTLRNWPAETWKLAIWKAVTIWFILFFFFFQKLNPLVLHACCLCVHAVEGCPLTAEPREAVGLSGFGYFVLENQPSVVWQKKTKQTDKQQKQAQPRCPTCRFGSKKKKPKNKVLKS